VRATLLIVAPQVSFNFGTGDGWSYLSGGVGAARVQTASAPGASNDGGIVTAFNAGGGARWFVTPRLAVGFDVRLHWMSSGRAREGNPAAPRSTVGGASAGFSFR
jgi:hypothetical protein